MTTTPDQRRIRVDATGHDWTSRPATYSVRQMGQAQAGLAEGGAAVHPDPPAKAA